MHGFCKIVDGKALLAFTENAPIVSKPEHKDIPLQTLVVAENPDDLVVGYSVVKVGEAHGFLWNTRGPALEETLHFAQKFGTPYSCIALKTA